ncbi:MAG: CoB--CoM heterodisulfide reductase iron-sulfur subunit A family protein [Coriobacteriia bacterium]|nr:CoB--CoM heterodisulfide reductase iron-sulfur subunit A family protein [Coriobacteriia bacterium]
MSRIGVFLCHCGTNIAATVDMTRLAEATKELPGVVYVEENKYMCSEPGQQAVKQSIIDRGIDRIVIASCSPRMHELTFRKMLTDTSVNPYMLEIANIREQCSWVHKDKEAGTKKAIDLVRMAVAKVDRNAPLFTSEIPITKRALVIGGGIAGIQAALDIADAGFPVTLVEKEPSIGGKMVMLDKTFPTMDCSACICAPKMNDVGAHPNIEIMSLSEVEEVTGYVGNFTVTIRQKAKYIDYDLCTGCGLCEQKCPSKVTSEYERGLAKRKAVYKPFAQAVPSKPIIDAKNCRKFTEDRCGVCEKLCTVNAIRFDDEDKLVTLEYGAVIIATGYELIDWTSLYGEYGAGAYPDVIDGLTFERIINASGPTEGHIVRPSDGKEPKTVVMIKCVGSRDPHKGKAYCSRACCMYGAKHAHQFLDKIADGECYVFYMDVRAMGKGYDEFYMNTLQDGATYIRGRVAKIYPEGDKYICIGEDTISSKIVTVSADLVVLDTAMEPQESADAIGRLFGVSRDLDGWLTEAHPKLRPVETNTAGVYLAGTAQGPKDIPDCVAQASAAAAKVIGMFCLKALESNPMISVVDEINCRGCGDCVDVCPYKAIAMETVERRENSVWVTRDIAVINSGLCQGCGACTASCKSSALDLLGFTNEQILQEVDALCL